jgi:hypothetical protein
MRVPVGFLLCDPCDPCDPCDLCGELSLFQKRQSTTESATVTKKIMVFLVFSGVAGGGFGCVSLGCCFLRLGPLTLGLDFWEPFFPGVYLG